MNTRLFPILACILLVQSHLIAKEAAPTTAEAKICFQRGITIEWNGRLEAKSFMKRFETQFQSEAQKQLGVPASEVNRRASLWYQIDGFGQNQNAIRTQLQFTVRVDPATGATREKVAKFVEEQSDSLRKQVEEFSSQSRAKAVSEMEKKVNGEAMLVREADHELRILREQLQATTGQIDVSSRALAAAAAKTQEQFQQSDLDYRAKEARKQALEKALAALSEKVEFKVRDDPIVGELQKVVDIREKELARQKELHEKQKVASASDVDQAVIAAAEARAKLIERKREAAAEAGGPLMEQLNKELLMLSIDSAEQTMRYKILKDRREALRTGINDTHQIEALDSNRSKTENQMEVDKKDLEDLRNQLENGQKPNVDIRPGGFVDQPEDRKELFGPA